MDLYLTDREAGRFLARRGSRQTTPALLEADRLAATFAGLPPDVTRWSVMRAVRNAAFPLGLSARELQLLETYIEHSYDADWEKGAEPIIITPLAELAEILGVSERQVRNIEAALLRRGLITFRDCGNHIRRGRRDRRTGRLLHGYGPSLAPTAARYREIVNLGEQARRDRSATKETRLAIAALRRRIRADCALLENLGLATAASAAKEALSSLPGRHPAGVPLDTLQRCLTDHSKLAELIAQIITQPHPRENEISAQGETCSLPFVQRCFKKSVKREPPMSPSSDTPQRAPRSKEIAFPLKLDHGLSNIGANEVSRGLSQRFRLYGNFSNPPSWAALTDKADLVTKELNIAAQTWGEACHVLGRKAATVALILIDARTPLEAGHQGIADPNAYLRGMTARGQKGQLRLDVSLHALLKKRKEQRVRLDLDNSHDPTATVIKKPYRPQRQPLDLTRNEADGAAMRAIVN